MRLCDHNMKVKKVEYGIVQGRLIQSPKGCLQWFPQEYWESEFFLAEALKYNFIELIVEREHNKNNPFWTKEGAERIKKLCTINNLSIYALCNDYIINHPLVNGHDALKQSLNVIERSHLLGLRILILPLFEESELTEENFYKYEKPLKEIADLASENNITVCLETVLNGETLLRLLERLHHPSIKCVFDTGNRIAFGHDIYSDILLLGSQIKHVHVKDKDNQNDNVILGTGKVNYLKVFQSLTAINYEGAFTFETCRGKHPLRTAKYNKFFVDFFVKETSENRY